MSSVKVRIYAGLRMSLGWREKRVELDESCRKVKCFLDKLPEIQKELQRYIEKGYNPVILVNGKNVFLRKGMDEELNPGDVLDIFPPSAGG
jgi:MoaD family protein